MRFLWTMLIFTSLIVSSGCANAGMGNSPLVGKKASDFKLAKLNGGEASLEELRHQGKAMVFFWSTWCPHCRDQVRDLNNKKAVFEKEQIAVILVNVGEEQSVINRFMRSGSYDLDVLLDSDGAISQAYRVVGIPTIVFIGADGNIRDIMHGIPDNFSEILN